MSSDTQTLEEPPRTNAGETATTIRGACPPDGSPSTWTRLLRRSRVHPGRQTGRGTSPSPRGDVPTPRRRGPSVPDGPRRTPPGQPFVRPRDSRGVMVRKDYRDAHLRAIRFGMRTAGPRARAAPTAPSPGADRLAALSPDPRDPSANDRLRYGLGHAQPDVCWRGLTWRTSSSARGSRRARHT